jgi:hypothetical protein
MVYIIKMRNIYVKKDTTKVVLDRFGNQILLNHDEYTDLFSSMK